MSTKLIIRNIEDVTYQSTSHQAGLKKVLFSKTDVLSNVTQVAFGLLKTGEKVEEHVLPTMEEFFFVIDGEMEMTSCSDTFRLKSGDCILIPPQTIHTLKGLLDCSFYYWGVKI